MRNFIQNNQTSQTNRTEICDEATARSMAASLLSHAREVNRYAVTYCANTSDNDYLADDVRATFVQNLKRMLKDLQGLMLLASHKGVSRYCNVEQIDAYMDAAHNAINNPVRASENTLLLN